VIDLNGKRRDIRSVSMIYKTLGRSRHGAIVKVFAR
jgi:hypothetical protein